MAKSYRPKSYPLFCWHWAGPCTKEYSDHLLCAPWPRVPSNGLQPVGNAGPSTCLGCRHRMEVVWVSVLWTLPLALSLGCGETASGCTQKLCAPKGSLSAATQLELLESSVSSFFLSNLLICWDFFFSFKEQAYFTADDCFLTPYENEHFPALLGKLSPLLSLVIDSRSVLPSEHTRCNPFLPFLQ